MSQAGRPGSDLRALFEHVEAAPPVDALDVVADELAAMVRARSVNFLIVAYGGHSIVRFGRTRGAGPGRVRGSEHAEAIPLTGTVYEKVLRSQQVDVRELTDGSTRVTVPVTVRGDAIGVLELELPTFPTHHRVADAATVGHALGYIVTANRRYTDLFEWGQRTTPLSLSAEIQHRLLPSAFTCEAGQFTVAGWLEPASTVGGDTFDYALDRDRLHLSITDAAGHDVDAAMLATVLVGALRNARRRGLGPAEQVRSANDELAAHSPVGMFVTGQVAWVDLDRQTAAIVNAGHPLPLRLRDGQVEIIELAVDMPFGVRPGRSLRVQELTLRPGDRIVFITDGMLERNAAGLDVYGTIRDTAQLHPREVVHALGAAVLRATDGNLRDDATVVCLDWYGGAPRHRESNGGASDELASG